MTTSDDRDGAPRPRGWRPAERRIVIRTESSTRYVRVSPGAQLGLGVAALLLVGWSAVSTAAWMTTGLERRALEDRLVAVETSFESRIAQLERERDDRIARLTASRDDVVAKLVAERDMLRHDLHAHEDRLSALTGELSSQQMRLVEAAEAERELSIALETLQTKLRDAVARRDAAVDAEADMAETLGEAENRLASVEQAETDWAATMQAVSDALEDAASTRDAAMAEAQDAEAALAALQAETAEAAARRARMLDRLEDAVQVGLGALETVFDRAGLDVERLVESVRREYAGSGGPFIPVAGDLGAADLAAGGLEGARVAALMQGLERASLMKIAAEKLPLAKPVRSSFRFTSGFGVRRDPKNGRARMHNGTDFAAGRGTPIYATGEGVVTFAGWQSGYGRVVKIRHAFGYETVYAHMNKLRVNKGERVAQGDRIGDMGNTGRSTGVHLHYEVRVGGKPVNPLKYIEAARNVL
ncbi:DUF5930 domain-containing protein [Rhodovulum sp. DZ06]|uniref:DUF5930 domain-containing protein n=1 Tax=Rhodovulum sp. DZ06 TaxID=3425126 RepID=UPI003D33CFEF